MEMERNIPMHKLPKLIKEAIEKYYTDTDVDPATLFARYHRMASYNESFSEEMNETYDKILVEYYAHAMSNDATDSPLQPTWALHMVKCFAQVLRRRGLTGRQQILATFPGDMQFLVQYLLDVWEKHVQFIKRNRT